MEARISSRNVSLVVTELQQLGKRTEQAAAKGLARGLLYTVGVVQREFLMGPRPQKLGIRTMALHKSITSRVDVIPDRGVVGRIGTNIVYGAFHEFGFHGSEQVRGYTSARLNPSKGKPGLRFVTVRPHTRQIDYAGRPFVRPALQKSLPVIIQEIRAELDTLNTAKQV